MKSIEILFVFLTALIAGDFKKAHGLTSKTWGEKNSPDNLKNKFKDAPKDLSFEIDRIITDLPTEQAHVVNFNTDQSQGSAKITLIREAWPGRRDAQGDWGIDPDTIKWSQMQDVKVVVEKVEPVKVEPKPEPEPVKEAEKKPVPTKPTPELIAKAEDNGIDIPDGATAEQLQELINKELQAETPPPAPKTPPKKPAAKKPVKKGGTK